MAFSPTPEWADEWVKRVAQHEGKPNLPTLTWLQSSKRRCSSGHFKHKRNVIHVSAGRDLKDQQYVLVHELAHWVVGGHHHHNRVFFKKLWDLCPLFDIPAEYALKRDGSVYSGCIREALRRGLVDQEQADAALKNREALIEYKRKRAARQKRPVPPRTPKAGAVPARVKVNLLRQSR